MSKKKQKPLKSRINCPVCGNRAENLKTDWPMWYRLANMGLCPDPPKLGDTVAISCDKCKMELSIDGKKQVDNTYAWGIVTDETR